jgi:hypothetical protein
VAITVDGEASRWEAALAAVATGITIDGPRLEFTLTAGRDVPDAVAALAAAGARIHAVGERTSSLEDAYLALVHRHE